MEQVRALSLVPFLSEASPTLSYGHLSLLSSSQSLCHFFQSQLTTYYHLVSILEGQMNASTSSSSSALAAATGPDDAAADEGRRILEGSGLTLKRLGVWTREVKLKMRLMSLMADECAGELFSAPNRSCQRENRL